MAGFIELAVLADRRSDLNELPSRSGLSTGEQGSDIGSLAPRLRLDRTALHQSPQGAHKTDQRPVNSVGDRDADVAKGATARTAGPVSETHSERLQHSDIRFPPSATRFIPHVRVNALSRI